MSVTIWLKMTLTFNSMVRAVTKWAPIFFIFFWSQTSKSESVCRHVDFEFEGLDRSDESWLRDYLELDLRKIRDKDDLNPLVVKMMTTDIFESVEASFNKANDGDCEVTFQIKEKWTRIPVVRGAYGGGTPLLILGGYETNAFGQLLALGGELRRYGDMPPGAFFFFKSPRAWRGYGLWGGEVWLDRRRRAFYDSEGVEYGHADSESLLGKFRWLYPIFKGSNGGSYQAGFHAQIMRENPSKFFLTKNTSNDSQEKPNGLTVNSDSGMGAVFGPMIAYDNLAVFGLNMSGLKANMATGMDKSSDKVGTFIEGEFFGYLLLADDFNLAGRVFTGSTTKKTLGSVYYLGGFDSVRGLPDGIHFGNKTVYGNFEARVVTGKFKYAHLQSAIFMDTGSAWLDGDNPYEKRETSFGCGIRIAIPQVYRLVLRVDYGVSIGHTKSRGFSIGLNQFFQPYKLVF